MGLVKEKKVGMIHRDKGSTYTEKYTLKINLPV